MYGSRSVSYSWQGLGRRQDRMNRAIATVCRLTAAASLAAAVFVAAPAQEALAHGGRIKPPEPKYKPGDGKRLPGRVPEDLPPFPAPKIPGDRGNKPNPFTPGPGDSVGPGRKPPPPAPITPPPRNPTGGQGTQTTPKPTVPGTPLSGRPRRARGGGSAFASPWLRWEMWWDLNRWSFFPERGDVVTRDAVVTPSGGSGVQVDKQELAGKRRALVTRQHIIPFLLGLLKPENKVRDEVRSAALIALAKVSHDGPTIELLFRYAEDAKSSALVRESAAMAVGMLRRGEPNAQLDGTRLDTSRARLLEIVDAKDAPDRTRAFAALAIGLLGDQPFGSAFTKDGRVITRGLWDRALARYSSSELPVALLTAVGMQPRGGTGATIREGLQRIVYGRRIGKRSWDANERSHALAALVRQKGEGWTISLFRVLTARRIPASVRQAAFIAVGAQSLTLSGSERLDAVEATGRGIELARDNLSRGLGLVALGRLVSADVAAGSSVLVERSRACAMLLDEARRSTHDTRGFAALALSLAIRGAVSNDADVQKFIGAGRDLLARGFEKTREPRARGAYAVALGLLGKDAPQEARAAMTAVLADRKADSGLRGHVALSLAQIGEGSTPVRRALRTALWDKRSVNLRSQAALALSFIGGRSETSMLVRELRNARSQWVLQQVAAALGQLGDVGAVPAILEVAGNERRADEARALAIASLGLLGDPEARPSMLRLTLDANYPARTDALHEAFSIL